MFNKREVLRVFFWGGESNEMNVFFKGRENFSRNQMCLEEPMCSLIGTGVGVACRGEITGTVTTGQFF